MEVTDTELLDYLESLSNGNPWVCRLSFQGRGARLQNSSTPRYWGEEIRGAPVGIGQTAREAIRDAIRKAEEWAEAEDPWESGERQG